MSEDKPDHDYKVDTKIRLSLNIGIVGGQEKTFRLGELIDASQDDLDSMSEKGIEGSIHEALVEWSHEYIDMGWEEV